MEALVKEMGAWKRQIKHQRNTGPWWSGPFRKFTSKNNEVRQEARENLELSKAANEKAESAVTKAGQAVTEAKQAVGGRTDDLGAGGR